MRGSTRSNSLVVSHGSGTPPEAVRAQLDAVLSDIGVDAVKTGMLASVSGRRSGRRAVASNTATRPTWVSPAGGENPVAGVHARRLRLPLRRGA